MLGATVAAKVGAMPGPSSHRGDTCLCAGSSIESN